MDTRKKMSRGAGMESGEPDTFPGNPLHLATTPSETGKGTERFREPNQSTRSVESTQVEILQATIERLERRLENLAPETGRFSTQSFLDSSLVKAAMKRLKFDIRDVHSSLESWDLFFTLYNGCSDIEKFYAVEQLLPAHLHRALAATAEYRTSYIWLVSKLREKFEPRYMCHEMANRSVSTKTNMNELEGFAVEAASCPQEQLIKHFMLEACSSGVCSKMKPFMFLPMTEFKFRLKLAVQEDSGRNMGGHSGSYRRVNEVALGPNRDLPEPRVSYPRSNLQAGNDQA